MTKKPPTAGIAKPIDAPGQKARRLAGRTARKLARRFGVPVIQKLRRPAVRRAIRRLADAVPPSDPLRMQPDGVISVAEWMDRSLAAERFTRFPAEEPRRCLPRAIDPEPHWKFKSALRAEAPPTFVASIPEGRVIGREGFSITPDGFVLKEVSKEWFVTPEQHSLLFKLRLPPPRRLPGRTANLAFVSGHNYYHWLFDVLSRIALLEQAGHRLEQVDHIITNSDSSPFQRESLDLLGIPREKRVATAPGRQFVCDELLAPSPQGFPGQTPRWACDFLRRRFLPAAGSALEGDLPRRIYVSRQSAAYRRVLNHGEFEKVLGEFGFVALALETMGFGEQARAFAAAEVVLAPHGAGLANLAFCRPGTRVLELFAPNYVNECFWALACQMELDYSYVLGQGARPAEFHDPHRVEDDILADSGAVRAALKLAGC